MIRTRSTAVLLRRRAVRSHALAEALRHANERAAQLDRDLLAGAGAFEALGAGIGATLARHLAPRSSSNSSPIEAP